MVYSKGRGRSSRLYSRSIDLSPLNPRQRRSRSQQSVAPKKTARQTAAAARFPENLASLAAAEPTLPASCSRPLLLACHVCLKGKDAIRKPVVTYCGHLFCWRCLLDRLPSDGPLHDDVMLYCPVCETPLCGGSSNKTLNSIIPVYRKNGPVTDDIESDTEQPLPEPNAFPIWILNEKVQIYHETANAFKSAEQHFTSMLDGIRETCSTVGKRMKKMMKSIERQLSISADAASEQIMKGIDGKLSIS